MSNREIKLELRKKLIDRNIWSQQVSSSEIRTRCPFCGDTQKNSRTGHLYIRINPDDNFPIMYNCFKCPASGVLKYEDLELLGIEDNKYKSEMQTLNKTSDKVKADSFENVERYFQYKLPTPFESYDVQMELDKVKYLEDRLGLEFSMEDLRRMKVITSLKEFLKLNDIHSVTCKPYMARLVEDHYIGFLTSNNSHILFRDITEKEEIKWYKYPITEESRSNRVMYIMQSEIDLFSSDKITINLSEGVMDCVSVEYNIKDGETYNILNIAVCGKFYVNPIKYLIGMGFVGSNISVNIYSDNDHTDDTSIDYYRKILKRFSFLFGELNVFYNMKEKDCGVKKSEILLQKFKI